MKTGYDQFFKQARKASVPASLKNANSKSQMQSKSQLQSQPQSQPQIKYKKTEAKKAFDKKQKAKSSTALLTFSLVGVLMTGGGYLYLEEIEKFLDKVEISFLPTASAEESEEKKPIAEKKEEAASEKALAVEVPSAPVPEFVEKLTDRKKELDLKEEELKRLESEVDTQRVEIEKRLLELQKTREEISKALESRVALDAQRVDALVQVYSTMKPQQAAKILETLDQQLVVEILGKMKKKNAAEVMNVMKPEKVQAFSEQFAGYRSPSSSKTEAAPEATPQASP